MNKILVIGGAGFVGRHIVARPVDRGLRVTSVEDQPSGRNKEFDHSIAQRKRERDLVEEASTQSFPASDPPAWISGKTSKRRVTS